MNAMTEMKNLRIPFATDKLDDEVFRHLEVEYDFETKSMWTYMKPPGTPCFSLGLLAELRSIDKSLCQNDGQTVYRGKPFAIDYAVLASKHEKLFNYGGDLALFITLIRSKDREALLHYAALCIDCIFDRIVNYNTSAVTISLVQGEALGGGFEYALTSNVIIAEESSRMGLPEILFNLFPGMGAYSLLARRLGAKKAEEMILSGKIYEARELFDLGIVDVLAPHGEGENAVYDFIRQNKRRRNGMRAMYECRLHTNPVTHKELMNITEAWVDAALRLEERDLKMMERLVRAQMRQQELRKTER
jgi:DSF synthase